MVWIDGQTASIQLPCLCSGRSRRSPATHWQPPSPLSFAAGLQERFESIAFHRHQKMVWRKQSSREEHRRAEEHLRPSVSTSVLLGFDGVSQFGIAGATCLLCGCSALLRLRQLLARSPRVADQEDGRPVLPGAALRDGLQLLPHRQEGLPVGHGHDLRCRRLGETALTVLLTGSEHHGFIK